MKTEPFTRAAPGDVVIAVKTLLKYPIPPHALDCMFPGQVAFIIARRDIEMFVELDLLHNGRILTVMCWQGSEARHWTVVNPRP